MKHKQILMAGAAAIASFCSLAGASVYASSLEEVSTIDQLKTCLENASAGTTGEHVCQLSDNIALTTSGADIAIPNGTIKVLDLNGKTLNGAVVGDNTYRITISNNGNLVVKDSGTGGKTEAIISTEGNLTIQGGTFQQSIYTRSSGSGSASTSVFKIEDGTFNGPVRVEGESSLGITKGVFNDYISASDQSTLTIADGTFTKVSALDSSTATINGGTYLGDGLGSFSMSGGASTVKINDGDFKKTVFCGSDNSSLDIAGGKFVDMNCITYHSGAKLTISGGTFTQGFSVGLQTLKITGGKFLNGTAEDGGWLALILDHPDDQDYSITGGTFVNTRNEYGYLMAINMENPTKAKIEKIFEGGHVLDDKWIEIGSTWSYIMKVKTDDDDLDGDVKVPDTGHSTMNGDNMSSTSIAIIVASALAGSLALGAAAYFGLHKKVAFGKK